MEALQDAWMSKGEDIRVNGEDNPVSCVGQEEVAGNSRFPELEVRGMLPNLSCLGTLSARCSWMIQA